MKHVLGGVLVFAAAWAHAGELHWEPTDNKAIELHNQAVGHLRAERYPQAAKALRKAAAKDPDSGLLALMLGQVLFHLAEAEQALLAVEPVRAAFPQRIEAHLVASQSAFALQRFGLAREAAQVAWRLAPDSTSANEVLLQVLLRRGENDLALERIDAAEQRRASPVWACLRGRVFANQGDFAGAREQLPACLRAQESSSVHGLQLALAADPAGRDPGGVEDLAGEHPTLRLAMACNGEDDAGCVAAADAYLGEHPDDLVARLNRGLARWRLGETGGARRDFEVLREGEAWVDLHEGGSFSGVLTSRAEAGLDRSMRDAGALLVVMLLDEGKPKRAAAARDSAIERFGEYGDLLAADGLLAMARGAEELGWQRLQQALRHGDRGWLVADAWSQLAFEQLATMPDSAVDALAESADATTLSNGLRGALNAQSAARCQRLAEALTRRFPSTGEAREAVALGHQCAVAAGDLEAAQAWVGRGELLAAAAAQHGRLLHEAGRHSEALAWIDKHDLLAGPHRQVGLHVCLLASVATKDWPRATACASTPDAHPRNALYVAQELAKADQRDSALSVLQAACPRVQGADVEFCESLEARLRGHTPP